VTRKIALAATAALAVLMHTHPARAGSAEAAETAPEYRISSAETAQQLADRALACLKRGEDATNEQIKRSAYQEGFELGKRAVAKDDTNADAHFAVFANQGRLLLLDGGKNPFNLARVNRELDRTLELNPNHSDALAAKGGLYRQLPRLLGGNLDKAEDCLKRSIAINPDAVNARIELAETYRDKGEPELGTPLLQTAAQLAEQQQRFRDLSHARELLAEFQASR
jgi:tetratricopeptide (TPR) repeat protein